MQEKIANCTWPCVDPTADNPEKCIAKSWAPHHNQTISMAKSVQFVIVGWGYGDHLVDKDVDQTLTKV